MKPINEMTLDEIRDELARLDGWVIAYSKQFNVNSWQKGSDDKGYDDHPIPPTLDAAFAAMPPGWRPSLAQETTTAGTWTSLSDTKITDTIVKGNEMNDNRPDNGFKTVEIDGLTIVMGDDYVPPKGLLGEDGCGHPMSAALRSRAERTARSNSRQMQVDDLLRIADELDRLHAQVADLTSERDEWKAALNRAFDRGHHPAGFVQHTPPQA